MENTDQNITTDNQGVKNDSVKGDDNPSVASVNDTNAEENAVPYPRFKEVNKKYQDTLAELNQKKADEEEARVKALEEQGKYKELNTELASENKNLKDKLDIFAKREQEEREGLLAQLDETDKEVYGSLTTEQLKKHLSKTKPTSQPTNVSPQTKLREDTNLKKNVWNKTKDEIKENWNEIVGAYQKK
tara:strand:- start:589 stop:1152 length:564 start_codon:yes stop_codon:yes gene_type:complete